MNQDEQDNDTNFLSRWSERKRKANLQDTSVATAKPPEEVGAPLALNAEGCAEEPFDLSSLPKLEDITETTELAVFLRKGVPESLRNAALRKAWALDPAIRNYVNPALDYAYDWNTPGGVPGNSELAPGTDIAKMVLQIMGGAPETSIPDKSDVSTHGDASEVGSASFEICAPQMNLDTQQLRLPDSAAALIPGPAGNENPKQFQVESLQVAKSAEFAPQQEVRRHGTAKPRI